MLTRTLNGNLKITGNLNQNNSGYGLLLPDTSQLTENRTLAITKLIYEGAKNGDGQEGSIAIDDIKDFRLVAFCGYKEYVEAPNKTTIVFDPKLIQPVNGEGQIGIFASSAKNGEASWAYRLLITNPVNSDRVY